MPGSTPNWNTGYVPPASEWNTWWGNKADYGLATGFSTTINGAPVTAEFIGSGLTTAMWGSCIMTATLPTAPEITAQFSISSNVGIAAHTTAYKIGLGFSAIGGPTSADIYGCNSNMQGYGGSYLITGYECDVNNIGVAAHTVGADTAVYGVVSVAAGTVDSTAAYWAISTSGGGWYYGFAASAAVEAAYFDGATCPIGIAVHGSHTTGIDMLAGFPITIAMALPNNSPIQQNDSSGTLRNLVTVDSGNLLQFGDSHYTEIRFNQSFIPSLDNVYTVGKSGLRAAAIWAANGTIQTSDPTLKTEVADLPAMLPLVMSLKPKSFKWISGGKVMQDVEVQQEGDLTETRAVTVQKVSVVNGVAVAADVTEQREFPLYDEHPMVDSSGKPILEHQTPTMQKAGIAPAQKMHKVPRRGMKTVTVQQAVDVPGKRTHAGLMAADVKAALTAAGVDYGAYVKAEDGTEALRPDQIMILLLKAFQELAAEVAALKAA